MRCHLPKLSSGGLWLASLIVVLLAAFSASAEPRVALVIGNSNYGGDLGLLPNPVNDAKLIAKTLRQVGFDVVEVEDADQQAMKKAIGDFGDKLANAGAGSTGPVLLCGTWHPGRRRKLPGSGPCRAPQDQRRFSPGGAGQPRPAADDFAASSVNIVVLDACRNNPLADTGRGITRGLAEMKTKPIGSFISYSTAPGEVAVDGNGENSPYSAALARAILQPGLDLSDVFRKVRKDVLKATNQKQVPWDSWSLTDPYYFIPPSAAPQPLAGPGPMVNSSEGGGATVQQQVATIDPKVLDNNYWEAIKDSTDPADFQGYLDQFPSGTYARLAAKRLQSLGGGQPAQTAEKDRTVPEQSGAGGTPLVFTASDQIVYTKEKTTLYGAPAETADIIAKPLSGLAIRASGRSPDGSWWQLLLPNGRTAYAKNTDVDERPDAATPPPQIAQADAPATDQSASTAGAPPEDAAAKQYFDLGQVLLDQGDLKGARDAFDKAAARDPKDAQAVLRRGQAALMMGDLDPALADFDHAITLDPDALEAHGLRILARLENGDAAGAADAADEVQQVEPTFWSANAIAAYYPRRQASGGTGDGRARPAGRPRECTELDLAGFGPAGPGAGRRGRRSLGRQYRFDRQPRLAGAGDRMDAG